MGDDFAAPVKVLLKALHTGIKLSIHILASASSANTTKALQISETVPNVQKSLERTSQAIRDAYNQTFEACGVPFGQALVDDKSIANRLNELKNELRDKIAECQDYEDEPDSFDPTAFANIQKESQKCYATCVSVFDGIRGQILESRAQPSADILRDDRASLTSMRLGRAASIPERKPLPTAVESSKSESHASLSSNHTAHEPPPLEPTKPKSPWVIDGSSHFDLVSSPQNSRQFSRDLSPSSLPQQFPVEEQSPHIAKEVVRSRINANEEFLERRRRSKVMFQDELRRQSTPISPIVGSLDRPWTREGRIGGTIDEDRVSGVFDDRASMSSPKLENSAVPTSPTDGRISAASSNSYEQMVSRQRSQQSQGARDSRASSFFQEGPSQRQELQRNDSTTSQDSIFGLRAAQSPPLSPVIDEYGRSSSVNVENLATTLRTPIFGRNVPDGMEVANGAYDFSTEKMVVVADDVPQSQSYVQQVTPTASMKSLDLPMRHDTSFYQYRGFCEGAAILTRGRLGEDWYKIIKRPLGNYSTTVSAKCLKCSYEVGYNDLQRDKILDIGGIYMNSGIRWRQRFVTKSHLRAATIGAGLYACVFCVEEHKTLEEHDATVFFSVQHLFRHLSKHTQPLPRIPGITVLYGAQSSTVLDFDLHFTTSIPKISEYSMTEIRQKVATRPSGYASAMNHPKPTASDFRDPDGNPVLHFVIGARIVGITFPDRFKGEWCSGYHDGDKGSFPANTIVLEQPLAEDVLMNSKSTLVATARWDFKPKDAKDARWLRFSKGDRISCVAYSFIDSWCWSGQNSKGKWGIFPRAFVDNLGDAAKLNIATSPKAGFGSKMASFSLGRKSSRQDRTERSMSIRSTGSGSSFGAIAEVQSGLEVASSSSQQVRTVGSWKV